MRKRPILVLFLLRATKKYASSTAGCQGFYLEFAALSYSTARTLNFWLQYDKIKLTKYYFPRPHWKSSCFDDHTSYLYYTPSVYIYIRNIIVIHAFSVLCTLLMSLFFTPLTNEWIWKVKQNKDRVSVRKVLKQKYQI